MLKAFEDPRVVACEPLYWDVEAAGLTVIDRYCALLGMTDPLNLFMGNYSHYSYLTKRWTDLPIRSIQREGYLEIQPPGPEDSRAVLPTMGSNGCAFRRATILDRIEGDYLFHLDFTQDLWMDSRLRVARAPIAVAHYYASSFSSFVAKSRLKVQDFFHFRHTGHRTYPYEALGWIGIVKFVLYSVLIAPTLIQAFRGYLHRRDRAWLLHPILCPVIAFTYGVEAIRVVVGRVGTRPFDREKVRW